MRKVNGFYRALMPRLSRLRCLVVLAVVLMGMTYVGNPVHAADAWTQQGGDINGATPLEMSGWSVAMSADGTSMAVGAPGTNNDTGSLRVFTWDGTTWNQRGNTLNGDAIENFFGISVAMSADGMTLVVGSSGSNGDSGLVRVYTYDASSTQWTQLGTDITSEAAGDVSGFSVAMSSDGRTVAIGAPYNAANGARSGQVRVFTWSGAAWSQRGTDIDGEAAGDQAGYSVAMSDDGASVAIGAPYNAANGSRSGQVRVFTWDGTAWSQRGTDIDGGAAGDQAGFSVAMSADGSAIAIGAPGNSSVASGAGQARMFTWSGTAWTRQGDAIDGEGPSDQFGYSVAMSADGASVVVGAPTSDTGGVDRGRVRAFVWNGTEWTQRGGTIEGETAGDVAGWSVAMSDDGTIIAEGAPLNDDGAPLAGQVRVFAWPSPPGAVTGPSTNFAYLTYFTFLLPDGRECSAISPMLVEVGTMVELPGVDANCRTMPGSTLLGWTIPVPAGFTGAGSSSLPFRPGQRVHVIESQRFTMVSFDPIIQIDYDANIAAHDFCTPTDIAHGTDDGRVAYVWVPRVDISRARFPTTAACTPPGHTLTGWNTRGDGTGTTYQPGSALPAEWESAGPNTRTLFAMWRAGR